MDRVVPFGHLGRLEAAYADLAVAGLGWACCMSGKSSAAVRVRGAGRFRGAWRSRVASSLTVSRSAIITPFMGTVLLTWELGAGIGHLMRLRPIGEELIRRGHRVVAAVRDLTGVGEAFAGSGIAWMPAPIIPRRGPAFFAPTHGFAQILGNIGFASAPMLATLFAAWNTIFDAVRPDLVVADHSPTALLALRGRPIRRVNMGLGFFCPPDAFPLPIWLSPTDALRSKVVQGLRNAAPLERVLPQLYRGLGPECGPRRSGTSGQRFFKMSDEFSCIGSSTGVTFCPKGEVSDSHRQRRGRNRRSLRGPVWWFFAPWCTREAMGGGVSVCLAHSR
jgi:hypothetical protein